LAPTPGSRVIAVYATGNIPLSTLFGGTAGAVRPPDPAICRRPTNDRFEEAVPLVGTAVNSVARTLGCAPDDIAADPASLRLAIEKISAAMAGMTRSSWVSTKSRVLKALRTAKVPVMSGRRAGPLSEEWAALYRMIPDDNNNGWKASLGRLISYCSDNQYPPKAVCDVLMERFEWTLKTTSLRGRPNDIVRGAIRRWNEAVDKVADWPKQRKRCTPSTLLGSGGV
jgi:hypothetical protein